MPPEVTIEQQEQRYRTIAVRVGEELHSQLAFLAQLTGSSISKEIRTAIQHRIDSAQDDPELVARAAAAQAEIEREAAARSAAIAGFMGRNAVTGGEAESTDRDASTRTPAPASGATASRRRRAGSKANG